MSANLNTRKSGPVFSNVSLIKRALLQNSKGKLPAHEILVYIKKNWSSGYTVSLQIDELVNMALYARKSFFEEDEDGLWSVKEQKYGHLDKVEKFLREYKQPVTLKEIIKNKLIPKDKKAVSFDLMSDIRFTQVQDNYWMLSDWELMNDLVHKYMQKNRITSGKRNEIEESVRIKYNLGRSNNIFVPNIDDRFTIKRGEIFIELTEGDELLYKNIEVPAEVKEEVGRHSVAIISYILNKEDEVKTSDIITYILNITPNNTSFSVYYAAVEEFLSTIPAILNLKEGKWIRGKSIPSLELEERLGNHTYFVKNSFPVIKNFDTLFNLTLKNHHEDSKSDDKSKTKEDNLNSSNNTTGFTTITYYERVKGYFSVPSNLYEFFPSGNGSGIMEIHADGFVYEWWWGSKQEALYFYGDSVEDFFTDFLVEPGTRLRIEARDNSLKVDIAGFDERYSTEQARYLDIGRLAEESKKVNKSIFTLMCETLSTYPSGMHWTALLENVHTVRATTRNTITNLLSKNECFVQVEGKKGYWRLDVRKLSRYYIDEDNKTVEQHQEKWSNKKTSAKELSDNSQKYHKSPIKELAQTDEEEYGLPEHWRTFSNWAKEQEDGRYQVLQETANNEQELIELVTSCYAKLLCRLAESRETYSVDKMDLVQEGFFGLIKACKNYDGKNSFAHYAKRWVLSKMLRYLADNNTLIRQPVHLVEKISKWEKLINLILAEKGEYPIEECIEEELYPNIEEYSLLRRIDYVSFEQYFMYLRKKKEEDTLNINSWLISPWYSRMHIDERTHKFYYNYRLTSLTDKHENYFYIEEEDDEFLWGDIADNYLYQSDLKMHIQNLLDCLGERDKKIVQMRFGLINGREYTLEEIGKEIGVTRERVRQIVNSSVSKIKKKAGKLNLQVYI